jgi:membrane-associated protease RseP (regulator of RpoE activity)
VEKLADPSMEGREAGTRGGAAAGNYVIDQFTRLHLQPAGSDGQFTQPFQPNCRNVLAMISGSDPELRDQTILVGAHYDHVGYGGRGMSLDSGGRIHPGADDNASGTSAVVRLAEAFAMLPTPPKRSVLFAAWDAEEKGMLGTKHWTAHPTIPIHRIVAAINLDMIGRLRNDHLTIMGSRTGYGWRRLLSSQNDGLNLEMEFPWVMKPVADHYPFFCEHIPIITMHTGTHNDYHRATDTAATLDPSGMARVTRLAFGTIYDLADRPAALGGFRDASQHESAETEKTILAGVKKPADRLGVGWIDDPSTTGGVRVSQITRGSPAEQAGLRVDDCILQFAGRPLRTDDDFYAAVSAAENPASASVKRASEEKPLDLTITLDGSPLRWGFTWRVDDAEPGTIILTHVVPGSPAAIAGLKAGDRIDQVGGHDFADEAAFAEQMKHVAESTSLTVERDGRLHTVTIQLRQAEPVRRAA